MKKPSIKAIDFFCGCGGLTYGLRKAGIDVFAGIDVDLSCQKTYEKNNAAQFIAKSIIDVTAQEVKILFRNNMGSGDYTLLAGCAPCQPYSSVNKRKKANDSRKYLLGEYIRIVQEVKPHFILMENVIGIAKSNKYFSEFLKFLDRNNYQYEYKTLNAKDFSVAQNRKRLFLVASRLKNVPLSFSQIKRGRELTLKDVIYKTEKIRHNQPSAVDILHRTLPLSPLNLKRIRATPKNGGLRSAWKKELRSPCHQAHGEKKFYFYDTYGRLAWDDLSATITTKFNQYYSGRFGHPDQDRALSLREGALIQSFPKKYKFFGSDAQIARQIGNAVPVNLSHAVGKLIVSGLKAHVV